MRIKNVNNSGFSLLEILLASIIFIITIGGLFATLNAVRAPVLNKENALASAIFGKQVLEYLRSSVNAGTYYNACVQKNSFDQSCEEFTLSLGTHEIPQANLGPTGLTWPSQAISSANLVNNVAMLSYTVVCSSGSQSGNDCTNGTNNDIARNVQLNISWPDAT